MRKLFFLLTILAVSIQAQDYKPGDHELFLMPTAYTMPTRTSYFSDYELLFLNYTMAVSPSTHIGAFTIFPITVIALESFTIGIKQNYYSEEKVSAAAFASYTPKISGFVLGNVFSFGKPEFSLHVGAAFMKSKENKGEEWIFMLGGRKDFSENVSGMVEYSNTSSWFDTNFSGLLNFGVRVRSTKMAWEFSGIRPLDYTGDFLFFPFIKVTFFFDGK